MYIYAYIRVICLIICRIEHELYVYIQIFIYMCLASWKLGNPDLHVAFVHPVTEAAASLGP